MMKKHASTFALLGCLILAGCGKEQTVTLPASVTESLKPVSDSTAAMTDVDAAAAAELIAKPDDAPIVIDVRTPEEFAEGHIEGAINIDFKAATFKDELAKLDKDKTYLMHCRSGGRSTSAKPVFEELGFKSVYHLDGGILAWEEAKQPVVKE